MRTLVASTFLVLTVIAVAAPRAIAKAVKSTVAGQGFVADFYQTEGSIKTLAVLVLGGSEGGKPSYAAEAIADTGYPTLSLAYFQADGLPDHLDMIPLEYFEKPIHWLSQKEGIRSIVLVGGSKGAEVGLLLASMHPEIKGVIARSPTSVVWQGLPKVFWPPRSSWSLNQKGLPFVPYEMSKGFDPNDLVGLYRQSLTQKQAVQDAIIPVEKIAGPILLLSGMEDKIWPSAQMADQICQRLKDKGFKYKYQNVQYRDAGHTLSEYYMLGGTHDGNQVARIDATKKISEFLAAMAHDGSVKQ